MTLTMTSKLKLFIQRMKENDEQAQWGFELLLKRDDFEEYFEYLYDEGLFSPERNPTPIPADQPGYVHVPFWSALNYLEAVAKLSGEKNDLELASKVLSVIRGGSQPVCEANDNYHTWRVFAVILGLVPSAAVTADDLDLIPVWLSSKYDRGLVGSALDKGIMAKYLTSDSSKYWSDACIVLKHCTLIQWVEEEGFTDKRKKPLTIVDDYWLKEFITHHASELGAKAGYDAATVMLERLQEVFTGENNNLPSWLSRPAIEDHSQNHSWDGPHNRFVEGLRNILLSWVDQDKSTAQPYIEKLLRDEAPIVQRVAIYILSQRWNRLCGLYQKVVGSDLFGSECLHELYGLLHDHFIEFSVEQKEATVEAIRQIPLPTDDEEREHHLRLIQRNWLSAIAGSGYIPSDTWFEDLNADPELKQLQEHPDFNYYTESWSGPGPSPYSVNEILVFLKNKTIVDRLNEFQQTDSWRGTTTRALVDTLDEAVVRSHQEFIDILPSFLIAKRPYQYGIISGFKRLWETSKDDKDIDWNSVWKRLINFFISLTRDDEFWLEEVKEDRDLTPTRNWIPPLIADMLHSGTKDDANAYSEVLLPQTWKLIDCMLENLSPEQESVEDAMHQAINSSKGKAIESLFSHALRTCRVADQTLGSHADVWAQMQHVFDREINMCKNTNFEFSTLAASYIANLHYLSCDWLQANLECIFPREYITNFSCAIEGLAYAQSSREIYTMLVEGCVLDRALKANLKGRHAREKLIERISLACLWGDENLDSPRFFCLFDLDKLDDLEVISRFFWSVSNQKLDSNQVEIIISFWERCIELIEGVPDVPAELLSTLSMLSCYIDSIQDREKKLLNTVAPYVGVGYNSDRFIESLNLLAHEYPNDVSDLLGIVLDSYKPVFDYQDKIKALLTTLNSRGCHDDALIYADKLRYLSGMQEFFEQLSICERGS